MISSGGPPHTSPPEAGWVETELGRLFVACTRRGVCYVGLGADSEPRAFELWRRRHLAAGEARGEGRLFAQVRDELVEFARGERRSFDVPTDLRGTDFQRAVWAELARIPFGATRTYAQVARALGQPGASRAVGMANGRNPAPILVPCHRVVAASGLGGFGGGLELKRRLLSLEGSLLPFAG